MAKKITCFHNKHYSEDDDYFVLSVTMLEIYCNDFAQFVFDIP